MRIAVEGCAHGELENIYGTLAHIEKENNYNIDLLICCGDFQSTRNFDDLKCMAVPPKYKDICTFYKYYSGEKKAPVLTIFIGGNHEASNYLQELAYGGWVAPNIYYMGYCGVIDVCGVRIGGLSGIFKGRDYCKGRYERPPYDGDSLRSCYHIRNLDVFRLKQLNNRLHIMLSHDWPTGVTEYGNVNQLLKIKPYFKKDLDGDGLGSKPGSELLHCLKPNYWFSGHLHVKFSALINHEKDDDRKSTKFLALDKCLPGRRFLQILDLEHDDNGPIEISYDLEWLTILKNTNHLISIKKVNTYLPGAGSNERYNFTPTKEEMDLVLKRFGGDLKVPQNFCRTVTPYSADNSLSSSTAYPVAQVNPQTAEFCEKLGIDDPMSLLLNEQNSSQQSDSLNLNTSSLVDTSSFITSDAERSSFISPSSIPSRSLLQSRTPMKLPQPKTLTNSTPMKEVELKRVGDDLGVSPIRVAECTTPASSENRNDESVEPKRFRRRNLDMYKTDEN